MLSDYFATILYGVRRGYDFSDRQKCVLFFCDEGPQTVRGMAALLDVAKPAITRAIDRLEDEGFVERQDDPADRRSVLITITEEGRDFINMLENRT